MKHSSSFLFTLTLCCLVSASCSSANLFRDEDQPGFVVSDSPYNNKYRPQTIKHGVTLDRPGEYANYTIDPMQAKDFVGNMVGDDLANDDSWLGTLTAKKLFHEILATLSTVSKIYKLITFPLFP
jgi:hypothetical protein